MILVVGGAGYIGSHFVKELVEQQEVIVLDNLSTGHREAIDKRATFIEGDLGDPKVLQTIFDKYNVNSVLHFAAFSLVGESVENPLKYYENNVVKTFNLLKCMIANGVNQFVFSSTAAIYGNPNVESIDESVPTNPINPYGQSKLMVENMLSDLSISHDFKYVVLRYFNAAGAHISGEIGESHSPETHLIPIVIQQLLGKREAISVFGTDYETADGTCIRDYIHVTDLARAHLLALKNLQDGTLKKAIYNLGNGNGFSVKQIIKKSAQITSIKPTIIYADKRTGDPARLVADSSKVYKELGWKAEFSIDDIIESAWKWHGNQKF